MTGESTLGCTSGWGDEAGLSSRAGTEAMVLSLIQGTRCGFLLVLFVLGAAGCTEVVRVPLAVPIPTVGGARPADPQGVQLLAEFGDGLWGQEQERAEMGGGGIAISVADRFEATLAGYASTREVEGPSGEGHSGAVTGALRAKVRLLDLFQGRGAMGIHVGRMAALRDEDPVQDEELIAWDVALPFEFYPLSGETSDRRLRLYAAPRLLRQSFRIPHSGASTSGSMYGILAGIYGQRHFLAISGELNLLHRPSLEYQGASSTSGWIVLPMGSFRFVFSIGD